MSRLQRTGAPPLSTKHASGLVERDLPTFVWVTGVRWAGLENLPDAWKDGGTTIMETVYDVVFRPADKEEWRVVMCGNRPLRESDLR